MINLQRLAYPNLRWRGNESKDSKGKGGKREKEGLKRKGIGDTKEREGRRSNISVHRSAEDWSL